MQTPWKKKMRSYVEVNKETGFKYLTVFYDSNLDDFDQAIEKGLAEYGLEHGEVNVIALPKQPPKRKKRGA